MSPKRKKVDCLAVSHPELSKEADGWDPSLTPRTSREKKSWECSKGHKWDAMVYARSRPQKPSGCPVCQGNRPLLLEGVNDLASQNPQVASRADGWDPSTVRVDSNHSMRWHCPKGHSWSRRVTQEVACLYTCSFCFGRKMSPGFNDLSSLYPEIARTADGWDPSAMHPGSNLNMKWLCDKGHSWETQVVRRTKDGVGCSVCSGRTFQAGVNDLATSHPQIAAEASGWDPSEYRYSSTLRKNWVCTLGHKWSAVIWQRIRSKQGCPQCSGKALLPGRNDLATLNPQLAAQAKGWDPSKTKTGSHSMKTWQCSLGHEWESSIKASFKLKTACPWCGNRKILVGFNDLLTTHPALAAEAHGWDPTTVHQGSYDKKLWKGACGHKWEASVRNRTRGRKSGCPSCARTGFNASKPAALYLLVGSVEDEVVIQFGISGSLESRLANHRPRGFRLEPLALKLFDVGSDAAKEERDLKFLQLSSGIPRASSRFKFSGSSEAFIWSKETAGFAEIVCSIFSVTPRELINQILHYQLIQSENPKDH